MKGLERKGRKGEKRGKRAKQEGRGHEEERRGWALSLRQKPTTRQEVWSITPVSYLGEERGCEKEGQAKRVKSMEAKKASKRPSKGEFLHRSILRGRQGAPRAT